MTRERRTLRWTDAEIRRLRALRQEGLSVAVIAERMGRKATSITDKLGILKKEDMGKGKP